MSAATHLMKTSVASRVRVASPVALARNRCWSRRQTLRFASQPRVLDVRDLCEATVVATFACPRLVSANSHAPRLLVAATVPTHRTRWIAYTAEAEACRRNDQSRCCSTAEATVAVVVGRDEMLWSCAVPAASNVRHQHQTTTHVNVWCVPTNQIDFPNHFPSRANVASSSDDCFCTISPTTLTILISLHHQQHLAM